MEEMRAKIFKIPQRELIHLARSPYIQVTGKVMTQNLVGLPEGCKVHHCYWDPGSMSFCLVVVHDSFGPVQEGKQIPSSGNLLSIRHHYYHLISNKYAVPDDLMSNEELRELKEYIYKLWERRVSGGLYPTFLIDEEE